MNLSRLRQDLKREPILAKLPKITNSYTMELDVVERSGIFPTLFLNVSNGA